MEKPPYPAVGKQGTSHLYLGASNSLAPAMGKGAVMGDKEGGFGSEEERWGRKKGGEPQEVVYTPC